ncbi:MAG: PAS domain-containing protein [bacterium]|nr:PAS domain-containing protein [bacterium]
MCPKKINDKITKAPSELEVIESYVKDLWRFLPIPICSVSPTHKILDGNTALAVLSGYREDELVGLLVFSLFSGDINSGKMFSVVLKKKGAVQEATLKTKTGTSVPVKVYSQIRQDEKGQTIGSFLGIVDMTKEKNFQREMEHRVREQTNALEEKVEELQRFQKMAVGREIKMVELKEKIEELEQKLQ